MVYTLFFNLGLDLTGTCTYYYHVYRVFFADLPGAVFDHSDGVVPLPVCPCRHVHQAALEIVHQIVHQEICRFRYHCEQLEWRKMNKN